MKGKSVVNYMSSHDDGSPYDKMRKVPFEAMTRLFLTPGAVQLYYGDETARDLNVEAEGDAVLRSFMNWDELSANAKKKDYTTNAVLDHTQKLGKFRQRHIAVGAGRHKMISESPYVFSRTYQDHDFRDGVVVGMNLPAGKTEIDVADIFADGVFLTDAYTGNKAKVENGKVVFKNHEGLVLLERS